MLYFHASNRITNPDHHYHHMIITSVLQGMRAFKWISTKTLSEVQCSLFFGKIDTKSKTNGAIWECGRECTKAISGEFVTQK